MHVTVRGERVCVCELCMLTRVCVSEGGELMAGGLPFLYQWQGSLRLLLQVKAD